MFKNDDSDKKNVTHHTTKSHDDLVVSSRQASLLIAILIMMSFILFLGGYFLGQHNAIIHFSNKIEQESFGDQIYSSMCSLCETGQAEEGDDSQDNASQENSEETVANELEPKKEETISTVTIPNSQTLQPVANPDVHGNTVEDSVEDSAEQQTQEANASVIATEYYAQLAGFGTVRAAQQFAHKLSRKEITTLVKRRQSRSAKGKFISWYQVVTEKFTDKRELETLVKKIEYEEKLRDVQIVTC